jgi:hypothetical protein
MVTLVPAGTVLLLQNLSQDALDVTKKRLGLLIAATMLTTAEETGEDVMQTAACPQLLTDITAEPISDVICLSRHPSSGSYTPDHNFPSQERSTLSRHPPPEMADAFIRSTIQTPPTPKHRSFSKAKKRGAIPEEESAFIDHATHAVLQQHESTLEN